MSGSMHEMEERHAFPTALVGGASGSPDGAKHNGERRRTTPARRRQKGVGLALGYAPSNDLAAARIVLESRTDALRACVGRRRPWGVQREIDELLKGTTALLKQEPSDVQYDGRERLRAAAAQFRMAQKVYYGHVQKTNRLVYISGVLTSVVALLLVAFLLYGAAIGLSHLVSGSAQKIFNDANLVSILVLLGFAGLGSLVSVLTRMERLPIPAMFPWQLVLVSGAGRPVVAAVFASVVYALLHGQIVGLGKVGSPILAGTDGPYWWCVVVAFLCGYSERFASDLLGRSPLGGQEVSPRPEQVTSARTVDRHGAGRHSGEEHT